MTNTGRQTRQKLKEPLQRAQWLYLYIFTIYLRVTLFTPFGTGYCTLHALRYLPPLVPGTVHSTIEGNTAPISDSQAKKAHCF